MRRAPAHAVRGQARPVNSGCAESPKIESERARDRLVRQLTGMNIEAAGQSRIIDDGLPPAVIRRAPSHRAAWHWSGANVEVRGTAPGMLVTQ